MRLYDYIMSFNDEEKEITAFDTNYSMEWYAYAYSDDEKWDELMFELYKLVTVEKINEDGSVVVNMSELIETHLEELRKADLFYDCSVDAIMADMTNTLAGFVGEDWFNKFVEALRND